MPRALSVMLCALSASAAVAQNRFVVADRTTDSLWVLHDLNGNTVIDEPAEVHLLFSAANAAGTLGPMNPTSLAIFADGTVLFGDQLNRNVYVLRDYNNDGDTQDAGESAVVADATNASLVSFAFPTGAGFDRAGRRYIANAGNSFGNDGLYRLVDLNSDGDAQDAGEVEHFVTDGYFGPGNGPYGPQEFIFDAAGVCYMKNSSTDNFAVYRFEDLDLNGRADDPGEGALFWNETNAAGVPATAGFPLEPDRVRPGALYLHQLAAGGVDQVVRVQDGNSDADALDAGESRLVYTTNEAGLTVIDLVCLRSGALLMTDNSGKKVYRLRDNDADGAFTTPGERDVFFSNAALAVADLRQLAVFPVRSPADMDCSGAVNFFDIDPFLLALFDGPAYDEAFPDCNRYNADCNFDFSIDFFDIDVFLALLFG
jgi:hypothetical protein